jgi:hypothetical protein
MGREMREELYVSGSLLGGDVEKNGFHWLD